MKISSSMRALKSLSYIFSNLTSPIEEDQTCFKILVGHLINILRGHKVVPVLSDTISSLLWSRFKMSSYTQSFSN